MTDHKDIHEAINAVMKEVGYVQKQKSDGLRYTYVGEAALLEAIRPSMVEHGIYVSVKELLKIVREQYATKSGTAMINTSIHGIVRFTHVSGSSIDVQSFGEGADSGDKSGNKALTGMYKYALRQTFAIETGDDPDNFSSDQYERTKKSEQKPQDVSGVDSAYPLAKEAKSDAEGFTARQFKAHAEHVVEIQKLTKKAMPEILAVINAIPDGEKRTIGQIVKELIGDSNGQ